MIAEFYDGKLSLASNVVNLNCKKKKKKKKKKKFRVTTKGNFSA